MADDEDFKVFISWAGNLAKGVAQALHSWLPMMFDKVDPWFSASDIHAGEAWFGEIQKRLEASRYGIIIVTTENFNRPWLNFEAGSLSKQLGEDRTRVTPVLVNFEQLSDLTGHPLVQYNVVFLNQSGMAQLCESIALSAGRSTFDVKRRFEYMWPQLEARINEAKAVAGDQPPPPKVSEPQQLAALTSSVRSLERAFMEMARGTSAPGLPAQSESTITEKQVKAVHQQVANIVGSRMGNTSLMRGDDHTFVDIEVMGPALSHKDVDRILHIYRDEFGKPVTLEVKSKDGKHTFTAP